MLPRRFVSLLLLSCLSAAVNAADSDDLAQLLLEMRCEACDLRSADLVHADLSAARMRRAQLQSANLSQSTLDGADLSSADLRSAILVGASLRGADLRSALLEGVDLTAGLGDLVFGLVLEPEHALLALGQFGAQLLDLRGQRLHLLRQRVCLLLLVRR